MITLEELQKLSRDRLDDAMVLYESNRIDWAIYTCGYAVELALKKKICETLKWSGYPNTEKEFGKLKCLKIHHLDTLLHLSGVESQILEVLGFATWSIIASWEPEMRYSPEQQTKENARLMLDAVESLLRKL